jgi:hypothetical protein
MWILSTQLFISDLFWPGRRLDPDNSSLRNSLHGDTLVSFLWDGRQFWDAVNENHDIRKEIDIHFVKFTLAIFIFCWNPLTVLLVRV